MTFELIMKTDNAAFTSDDPEEYKDIVMAGEVIRILQEVIEKLKDGKRYGFCIDINGNTKGEWELRQ